MGQPEPAECSDVPDPIDGGVSLIVVSGMIADDADPGSPPWAIVHPDTGALIHEIQNPLERPDLWASGMHITLGVVAETGEWIPTARYAGMANGHHPDLAMGRIMTDPYQERWSLRPHDFPNNQDWTILNRLPPDPPPPPETPGDPPDPHRWHIGDYISLSVLDIDRKPNLSWCPSERFQGMG